jgi:Ca-activated chloride channel family protein
MSRRFRVPFLVGAWTLALGSLFPALVQAQGILYPRPEVTNQPFYVKNLRVNTTITDSVAETSVEQTFVNSSRVEQEGTYLFPLPEGATPTAFSMTIGDRTLEPRILPREEARSIYEGIVRRRRDPALLEYVGRSLVRISVYPIPPNGERLIRMRYTELLRPENGLRKYSYPLSTSRFGVRPVGATSVSLRLRTTAPLKNVYSPTHALSIRRPDDRSASASWEGTNDASDRDLTLYFSTSDDDVGLSLLTYRGGDRNGYFLLMAAPRVSIPKEKILPKSVVFVLDRTGSMAGEKIKQARRALLYCLNSLRPQDRFNVIPFNEAADPLLRRLEPANEANLSKAKRFVEEIEASGGTNIDEALKAAIAQIREESGDQKMIVFLTDGLPTVGETNANAILRNVKDAKAGGARLFCFGVGYDVNVPLLDSLAEIGRGDADYVKPEEDIEVKVSAFYSKVASPVLAQLQLRFEGADVYDVYPKDLPDLCKGTQLIVAGRFREGQRGGVRLTGNMNGITQTFQLAADFGEADGRNAFLPRLWASRKIGYLIDQVRLAENPAARKEVLEEIARLSREYGIITEYTSFLVDEREAERLTLGVTPGQGPFYASPAARAEVLRRATRNGVSGQGATEQSLRAKDLYKNDQVHSRYQTAAGGVHVLKDAPASDNAIAKPAPGNFGMVGGVDALGRAGVVAAPVNLAVTVQAVNDRAFYRQKNNVWQDQSYDAKQQKLYRIQAFSDAHFALIKAVPSLAAYSSVGEEVIVRLGRNAVQFGKEGKTKLTAAELKLLAAR